jgi:hypothetical protein
MGTSCKRRCSFEEEPLDREVGRMMGRGLTRTGDTPVRSEFQADTGCPDGRWVGIRGGSTATTGPVGTVGERAGHAVLVVGGAESALDRAVVWFRLLSFPPPLPWLLFPLLLDPDLCVLAEDDPSRAVAVVGERWP